MHSNTITSSKIKINPSSCGTRGPRQGEATRAETIWNPFELDETNTTSAKNNFVSCNTTIKNETDDIFVRRKDFSNACDRKYFSRTKIKNRIGINVRRIKNHEDQYEHEEEPAIRGEANTDFIHKKI